MIFIYDCQIKAMKRKRLFFDNIPLSRKAQSFKTITEILAKLKFHIPSLLDTDKVSHLKKNQNGVNVSDISMFSIGLLLKISYKCKVIAIHNLICLLITYPLC